MKLTRLEETALIIVVTLAEAPQTRVSLSDICTSHGVPLPFCKKIARLLKNNSIITSKEGLNGGYQLASDPKELTVLSVLQAVGGKTFDDRSYGGSTRICPLGPDCIPQKIRSLITANLISYLSDVTINQFVKKGKNL